MSEAKASINAALIKLTFNTMLKKRAYTRRTAIAQLAAQSQFGGMAICAWTRSASSSGCASRQ